MSRGARSCGTTHSQHQRRLILSLLPNSAQTTTSTPERAARALARERMEDGTSMALVAALERMRLRPRVARTRESALPNTTLRDEASRSAGAYLSQHAREDPSDQTQAGGSS
jgi:hypothetical protein